MRYLLLYIGLTLSLSTAAIEVVTPCGANPQSRLLANLIQNDPLQQRTKLKCNSILSKVAQEKALEMADAGMVQHNLGGGPNSRLRRAGYSLPNYYGIGIENQVESIAGGYEDAYVVWRGFKASRHHREHLLGEIDFYREQNEIGVGFVKNNLSPHVEYWVVFVAKNAQSGAAKPFNEKSIPNKNPYEIIIHKK